MTRWNKEESPKRRESIISALVGLLKEKDLSDISVSELCARCGISRQLFYYHFDNMESLFLWAVRTSTKGDKERVSLIEGICDICGAFLSRKELTVAFLSSPYRSSIVSTIREDFRRESERYIRDNIDDLSEEQRRMLQVVITNGSLGIILDWVDDGMRVPIQDLYATLLSLVEISNLPGRPPH